MMKKEAKRLDDLKNLTMVKQDQNSHQNAQAGCKVKTETMDQDLKAVDCAVRFEDWRYDETSREYHLKELKKMLSSDPVLRRSSRS